MNTSPFHLTFGVELEFLLRYDPEEYRKRLQAVSRPPWFEPSLNPLEYQYELLVRQRMIQILNVNGFSTHSSRRTNVSEWTLTTDDTISDDGCENCYAFELVSPALDYSPSALNQVMEVVELLVSKFDIFVNKSCGLHVHVGNETRGFALRTLKNFASLITAFEKQLTSLHPSDRHQNGFAKPLYSAFRKDATPREKLLIIDELETVDDLICRLHPICDGSSTEDVFDAVCRCNSGDRYMAFNFFNLKENEPFKTIEFRQHQGTLDPNQIANWVRVACTLLHMSYDNGEGVHDVIKKHLDDTNYTAMDLLVDLNLPDLASFYAPLVSQYGEDPSSDHARGKDDESPVEQELGFSTAFQTATFEVYKFVTDL